MTAATMSHTFCRVCEVVKKSSIKVFKYIIEGFKACGVARTYEVLVREGHHKEARQLLVMYNNKEI